MNDIDAVIQNHIDIDTDSQWYWYKYTYQYQYDVDIKTETVKSETASPVFSTAQLYK